MDLRSLSGGSEGLYTGNLYKIFLYRISHRLNVATAPLTALDVPRHGDWDRYLTPESTRARLWAKRLIRNTQFKIVSLLEL